MEILLRAASAADGATALVGGRERRSGGLLEIDGLGAVLVSRFTINEAGRDVALKKRRRSGDSGRMPVRLRLVPLGFARARLVLQRGGEELDVLGEREGARWTWRDQERAPTYLRLLPRLEEGLRTGGIPLAAAVLGRGLVVSPTVLCAENGTRQRSGGSPS